jgi:adenosylhomocysteine nucleosidase
MTSADAPIAILGAMPEEIAALLSDLEGRADSHAGGYEIHSGELEGKRVLVVHCGIGKVNAAAVAQLLVLRQSRALIFTGVAGAVDPELRVGDIVVASDALQHDVDVTALGYEPGLVPGEPLSWRSDPRLVELAVAAAAELPGVRVVTGRVASGDQFVADPGRTSSLRDRFGASCVEMEGAAVAQVCSRAGVPFVIIRSMSDSADHDAQVSFREFTGLAAGRAKRLVREIVRRLPW